jgi:hypothetical protein
VVRFVRRGHDCGSRELFRAASRLNAIDA